MRILVLTIYSELSLYTCVFNFSVSSTFKFSTRLSANSERRGASLSTVLHPKTLNGFPDVL